MSLLSKAKKAISKAAKYLPGIAQAVPTSKGLANAAATLQAVSGVIGPGGLGQSLPGIAGPIALPKTGVQTVSMNLPQFPQLPGGGGGIVKTGLPFVAAAGAAALPALRAAAPAVIQGAKNLIPKISPRVAKALGWVSVGALVYDAAGNLMGRKAVRHMNPLNGRAAKRAIRRIKAVRKIVRGIESSLPKSKGRRC